VDYVPGAPADLQSMLDAIGAANIDDLFKAIPESLRLKDKLNMADGLSEIEVLRELDDISHMNAHPCEWTSFLGGGAHCGWSPSAAPALMGRGEFFTAYTPYQPETSQGELQAIFEYQSMMCRLTGMDVSNSSSYDGPCALADAMLVARAQTRREKIIVSSTVGPDYRDVINTYNTGLGLDIVQASMKNGETDWAALETLIDNETACVIIQSPNYLGVFEDYRALVEKVHAAKALMIHVFNPLALSLFATPGEMGADIAIGDGQCLGNPVNYGGPGFGIFTTRTKLIRKVPGRIVGQTKDIDGQRGYVLTLQTREQHIRREKATSNICTNQALCALLATIHLSLIGKQGFVEQGQNLAARAAYFIEGLNDVPGAEPAFSKPGFNEVAVKFNQPVAEVLDELKQRNILGGIDLGLVYDELKDVLLIAFSETHTRDDIDGLLAALKEVA